MANDIFPGATLMQLAEWGFPLRVKRPTPAANRAFSVVHVTGNSRLPSAENEAAWRINDPEMQNSASFFVNRDGSIVQTLGDPLHMDPYANGDRNHPDMSNPRIAWVVNQGYYNMNEMTLVAIENVGYEPGNPITPAQERSDAAIIAYYHGKAGVPVTRETVVGHYQINSVNRPNCPGVDKSVVDRIVNLAQAALPDTAIEDDDMPKILRRVVGQNARFKRTTDIRRGVHFADKVVFPVAAGVVVQPFAVVEGEEYDASPTTTSKDWLAYIDDKEQVDYFPAIFATMEPIAVAPALIGDYLRRAKRNIALAEAALPPSET